MRPLRLTASTAEVRAYLRATARTVLAAHWRATMAREITSIDDVAAPPDSDAAIMADVAARVPPRDARVLAVVHQDNARSLALCHRYGLTEELTRPHPSYRRLITGVVAGSIDG